MADGLTHLVRQWLYKAKRDLMSADRLASGESPLRDTAAYHCQQAAEKALKGALLYFGQAIPKTHDLRLLVRLLEDEVGRLDLYESAELLTPFATLYRYPDDYLEPTQAQYEEAQRAAAEIVSSVHSMLPERMMP